MKKQLPLMVFAVIALTLLIFGIHILLEQKNAKTSFVTPNGGRLINSVKPQFEFFLRKDQHAQITFLDPKGQKVSANKQVISIIGGDRKAPVRIGFVKRNGLLISEKKLPDMKRIPIVMQITVAPGSKSQYEKFFVDQVETLE